MKLIISILLFSVFGHASVPGEPGCLQTEYYSGILKLYALTHPTEAAPMQKEMNFIRVQACSGAYSESSTIYYKNGSTATNYAGREDATWYWPNGATLTNYAVRADATMYYPNGATMTNYFLRTDATYYYANNRTISNYIGRKGASLYLVDGSSLNSPGFELNGVLDFVRMADYVDGVNIGGGDIHCDSSTLKSQVRHAIQLIRNTEYSKAIDALGEIERCL
jgi:hypothetical protein